MPPRMRALVRSRGQEGTRACFKYSEAFVTMAVGGTDMDIRVIIKLRKFMKEECIVVLCSMERGGALTHKHFQVIVKGNGTRLPMLNKKY